MDAITRSVGNASAAITPPTASTGRPWHRVDLLPIDGAIWVNVQGGAAVVGSTTETAPGSVYVPQGGSLKLPFGTYNGRSHSGSNVAVNVTAFTEEEGE